MGKEELGMSVFTKAFDKNKIFNSIMTTPQMIVVGLLMLYMFGGVYIVWTSKAAKAKAKAKKEA
jgi:hypothetical protein